MKFLEYMRWEDQRILWEQPDWWVYFRKEVYDLEMEHGMLRQPGF